MLKQNILDGKITDTCSPKPVVTIDIISYNNIKFLRNAVKSVLLQKYNNIELVISDDYTIGSSIETLEYEVQMAVELSLLERKNKEQQNDYLDSIWDHFNIQKPRNSNNKSNKAKDNIPKNKYLEVLDTIKKEFPNIKSIQIKRNKSNLGTVKHLKTLKKEANGKYIMFLAADDMLHDEFVVSDMIEYFELLPENAYVLTSQCGMYDTELSNLMYYAVNDHLKKIITQSSPKELFAELTDWCIIPAAGTIYKKVVFDIYGDLDDRYHLIEDWTYFLKLSRNGGKIYYFDRLTYMHRDGGISHGNNTGGNLAYKLYLEDWLLLIQNEILPYLNEVPLQQKKQAIKRYQDAYVEYIKKIQFPTMSKLQKILFYIKNIKRYTPKACKILLEYNKERAKDILGFSFMLLIFSYLLSLNMNKFNEYSYLYYIFGNFGLFLFLITNFLLVIYHVAKISKKLYSKLSR